MASLLLLLILLVLSTSTSATAVSATSTLDPKQLKALQSLGIPTVTDPCIPLASTTTPHKVVTVCDNTSSPLRHLLQLHLLNCSSDLSLSLTALPLQTLATLQSLSFTNCPSLSPTGFYVILSGILNLKSVTISNASIAGYIPNSLPHNLTHVDFSGNKLEGGIPDSISSLSGLIHLDLSSNYLNGTVPVFLSNLKELRYLNLEKNDLHGVLPFNDTFVKRLLVFKVDGNSNLCYNDSILSSKLELGIAKCDKDGLPAARDSRNDEGTDDDEEDEKEQRFLYLCLCILIWLLLLGGR